MFEVLQELQDAQVRMKVSACCSCSRRCLEVGRDRVRKNSDYPDFEKYYLTQVCDLQTHSQLGGVPERQRPGSRTWFARARQWL